MNNFVLSLIAISIWIGNTFAGATGAFSEEVAIPISGLPWVSVDPHATLIPGQPTSLGSLITYHQGVNTQCKFDDYPDGGLLRKGPCSISYSGFSINLDTDHYIITGAWVNPISHTLGAVIGGVDPDGVLPDYTSINLTAKPGSSGAVPISGLINPQTITWSYGPIYWSNTVEVGTVQLHLVDPFILSKDLTNIVLPALVPNVKDWYAVCSWSRCRQCVGSHRIVADRNQDRCHVHDE